MVRRLGLGKNNHLSYASLALNPRVVQSIISLTGSLRVISLTTLADSIYNILIFFAEKMWVAFAHFFSKKFQHICVSLDVNFNESLTNDIVSFEQLGPDCEIYILISYFSKKTYVEYPRFLHEIWKMSIFGRENLGRTNGFRPFTCTCPWTGNKSW